MSYDYTIDNQLYDGIGKLMAFGPVQVSEERDKAGEFQLKFVVDDTILGLSEAIQQVGAAPVTVTFYNEKA